MKLDIFGFLFPWHGRYLLSPLSMMLSIGFFLLFYLLFSVFIRRDVWFCQTFFLNLLRWSYNFSFLVNTINYIDRCFKCYTKCALLDQIPPGHDILSFISLVFILKLLFRVFCIYVLEGCWASMFLFPPCNIFVCHCQDNAGHKRMNWEIFISLHFCEEV